MPEPFAVTGRHAPTPAPIPWLRRIMTAQGRSLEITRAGWLFIGLTLAVGFAAINSGSNLLHVVFGAFMALIVGSGALSEFATKHARARRIPPTTLYAKTPAPIKVELINRSDRVDVLSVSVEDDDRISSPDHCAPVFSVRIPPGGAVVLNSTVVMHCRGRHRLPAAVVATRFPFGLFVKRRDLPPSPMVTVYPSVHPVRRYRTTDERPGGGEAMGRVDRVGEFYGLREYREGDDPRRIYWPALARHDRPVTREHESLGDTELMLDLQAGVIGDPGFEQRVEDVASEASAALAEPGVAVGLRYAGEDLIPTGTGADHRRRILEQLAIVGTSPTHA